MSTSVHRGTRLAGGSLIVAGILANIPFAILVARFDYPEVLRRDPAEVLLRFGAAGGSLIATWYAYVLVAFLLAIVALTLHPVLSPARPNLARCATVLGVLAGVLQMIGLARWVFVVPHLADVYADSEASAATKDAAILVFDALNHYAGVAIGEHMGQMLTGMWTACVALCARGDPRLGRAWGSSGLLLAFGLLIGLVDGVAIVAGMEPGVLSVLTPVGYTLWSLWLVALGIRLWSRSRSEDRISARSGRCEASPRATA